MSNQNYDKRHYMLGILFWKYAAVEICDKFDTPAFYDLKSLLERMIELAGLLPNLF